MKVPDYRYPEKIFAKNVDFVKHENQENSIWRIRKMWSGKVYTSRIWILLLCVDCNSAKNPWRVDISTSYCTCTSIKVGNVGFCFQHNYNLKNTLVCYCHSIIMEVKLLIGRCSWVEWHDVEESHLRRLIQDFQREAQFGCASLQRRITRSRHGFQSIPNIITK